MHTYVGNCRGYMFTYVIYTVPLDILHHIRLNMIH